MNEIERNELITICGLDPYNEYTTSTYNIESAYNSGSSATSSSNKEQSDVLLVIEELKFLMCNKMENLEVKNNDVNSKISKLALCVEKLTGKVMSLDQQKSSAAESAMLKIEWPECPICKERIEAPMRLMQCGKGHIVRNSCLKEKTKCYYCSGEICGRPSALEQMLKL